MQLLCTYICIVEMNLICSVRQGSCFKKDMIILYFFLYGGPNRKTDKN
jgi:hypothetical protein